MIRTILKALVPVAALSLGCWLTFSWALNEKGPIVLVAGVILIFWGVYLFFRTAD